MWNQLAPDMEKTGVLTPWDVDALAVFCDAVINHRRASEEVNKHGLLVQGAKGNLVRNPAVQVARDYADLMVRFGSRFGLSPSDRAGLKVERGATTMTDSSADADMVEFSDPQVCGWSHRGHSCEETGDHFCEPRADHAEDFFARVLVHTKGRYARKPFILTSWQRDEIVRPLFGEATWNPEIGEYVRRYRIAWIELGRKNGKSEILAGIMLYLLVADGEESAELYGAARDRDQAALVFDVAAQMVRLSPKLSKRVQVKDANKRLVYKRTNSYYQVIAADAQGALGSNPHGVAADEILAWRNRSMWDALRTGMGSEARTQPLMVAATTAGDNPNSFAANMHNEMERIQDDPSRAPHIFTFLRNTPQDADPWDEKHWKHANPALGDFLSLKSMREEALEARNDPTAEKAFRQFRLNQWVRAATRWMPMPLYVASAGSCGPHPTKGAPRCSGAQPTAAWTCPRSSTSLPGASCSNRRNPAHPSM
ncbi:phage terminase small subunit P27 family [Nocardiopsis eucommiae]|uniref:Phage terminase small subunit P27 family n=1 Tax=Nocardiopsis eucommiae TaxID=2831970 RepID=A0A975L7I3_9ACTN|nr:phage terminase small subunit P27 family [Nocardiopsis eucommiae]